MSQDIPEGLGRPPTDPENAMAADARSRRRQAAAEDQARRERRMGMTGDGARIGRDDADTSGSSMASQARSIGETAGGIPDEAIGPAQSSVAELLDLGQAQDVEAMAAKLQAEADARRATPGVQSSNSG